MFEQDEPSDPVIEMEALRQQHLTDTPEPEHKQLLLQSIRQRALDGLAGAVSAVPALPAAAAPTETVARLPSSPVLWRVLFAAAAAVGLVGVWAVVNRVQPTARNPLDESTTLSPSNVSAPSPSGTPSAPAAVATERPPCLRARGDQPELARFDAPLRIEPPPFAGPPGLVPQVDSRMRANPTLPILALDGRSGEWFHVRNTTGAEGRLQPLEVLRSPEASAEHPFAIKIAGPPPVGWGANAGIRFETCYDARAYAGVEIRVRGTGVLFVGLQTMDSVPTQMGGRCTEKCWFTAGRNIVLSDHFESHQIRWSDLHGPGSDKPVAQELLQVMFSVQSGPEAYEFWLDRVNFIIAPEQ